MPPDASDIPVIRAATATDLPAIAGLAGRIWRAHYPGIISVEQIEYMLIRMFDCGEMQRQLASGTVYEQILLAGRLIGFASHAPTGNPTERKLDKLYVLPECQRRGFGGLLLRHVLNAARVRGCTSVMLTVNRRNRQAVAAYEKHGFVIRAETVVDIGGGFVMDDYVMWRPL